MRGLGAPYPQTVNSGAPNTKTICACSAASPSPLALRYGKPLPHPPQYGMVWRVVGGALGPCPLFPPPRPRGGALGTWAHALPPTLLCFLCGWAQWPWTLGFVFQNHLEINETCFLSRPQWRTGCSVKGIAE